MIPDFTLGLKFVYGLYTWKKLANSLVSTEVKLKGFV